MTKKSRTGFSPIWNWCYSNPGRSWPFTYTMLYEKTISHMFFQWHWRRAALERGSAMRRGAEKRHLTALPLGRAPWHTAWQSGPWRPPSRWTWCILTAGRGNLLSDCFSEAWTRTQPWFCKHGRRREGEQKVKVAPCGTALCSTTPAVIGTSGGQISSVAPQTNNNKYSSFQPLAKC